MPRTALVLGGSSDIAAAILSRLAGDGLERVVLAVRDVDRVPALPPGLESSAVAWDALDTAGHAGLVQHAADLLGRIDLVICAVGMLGHHAGVSMEPEQVDEMLRTNTVGPAAALAAVGAQLVRQRHGTVVVLSSVAGVRPRRSNYVYGSSKSGLDAFARGLADAVAADGVEVIVVRPGFVRSSMTEGLDPAPFATDPDVVAAAVQQPAPPWRARGAVGAGSARLAVRRAGGASQVVVASRRGRPVIGSRTRPGHS